MIAALIENLLDQLEALRGLSRSERRFSLFDGRLNVAVPKNDLPQHALLAGAGLLGFGLLGGFGLRRDGRVGLGGGTLPLARPDEGGSQEQSRGKNGQSGERGTAGPARTGSDILVATC